MSILETIRLGNTGPYISRLGMGCWAIGGHGWGRVKDEDSVRAIQCALENGVTFFDTADVYGLGKSETLLASVLGKSRTKVVIASKGGVRWNECGKVWSDISPSYLRRALEDSLRRLKLDYIPLYYVHKPDDVTPVQESIAVLNRMRDEGKIGAIGVANFSADQLIQALQVARVAAVQVRLNIFDRDASKELLDICRKHGITLVAWGALADGLLTGKFTTDTKFSADDHRSTMPEFSGDAFIGYVKCLELLAQLAASMGRQVSQLALRWVLDFVPFTCSLFGAKTDIQVAENLGADGWNLTEEIFVIIDSIAEKCKR
ncbi:MAG TPA: aldo/keto reductase [Syntrophales bacterium]|nr:aldo/keto reductase [Syntrophales bacterium]